MQRTKAGGRGLLAGRQTNSPFLSDCDARPNNVIRKSDMLGCLLIRYCNLPLSHYLAVLASFTGKPKYGEDHLGKINLYSISKNKETLLT